MHIYMYVYTYIYIYVYRSMYVYMYINIVCVKCVSRSYYLRKRGLNFWERALNFRKTALFSPKRQAVTL